MAAMAKATLSSLVQEHLNSLVSEAACIQRHAKRTRLNGSRLSADDVNLALAWRGSEKLYGTEGGGETPVDLNKYIKSESTAAAPSEVGMSSHWLAIDGVATTTTSSALNQEEEEELSQDAVRIRQLLPRLLSEELQLYFSRITIAMESTCDIKKQDAVLNSLSRDAGLQELVPFIAKYISSQLLGNIARGLVENCRTLVGLARALLSNPHLHVELQLHELLPALITCVVNKRLASTQYQNHWALRLEAAQVLRQACNLFGTDYATLQARILKTMCEAISPAKPLPTIYGGLVCITLFGEKAVDAFLLPLVIPYALEWTQALETEEDLEKRVELQHCLQALQNALACFLQQSHDPASRISYQDLQETFGEQLVVLFNDAADDYSMCVV